MCATLKMIVHLMPQPCHRARGDHASTKKKKFKNKFRNQSNGGGGQRGQQQLRAETLRGSGATVTTGGAGPAGDGSGDTGCREVVGFEGAPLGVVAESVEGASDLDKPSLHKECESVTVDGGRGVVDANNTRAQQGARVSVGRTRERGATIGEDRAVPSDVAKAEWVLTDPAEDILRLKVQRPSLAGWGPNAAGEDPTQDREVTRRDKLTEQNVPCGSAVGVTNAFCVVASTGYRLEKPMPNGFTNSMGPLGRGESAKSDSVETEFATGGVEAETGVEEPSRIRNKLRRLHGGSSNKSKDRTIDRSPPRVLRVGLEREGPSTAFALHGAASTGDTKPNAPFEMLKLPPRVEGTSRPGCGRGNACRGEHLTDAVLDLCAGEAAGLVTNLVSDRGVECAGTNVHINDNAEMAEG